MDSLVSAQLEHSDLDITPLKIPDILSNSGEVRKTFDEISNVATSASFPEIKRLCADYCQKRFKSYGKI